MPLAIISFSLECILIIVGNALFGVMSRGGAIFIIIMFLLCSLASLGSIVYNSNSLKIPYISKGVSVTGLVFSILGTIIGVSFFIIFFVMLSLLPVA